MLAVQAEKGKSACGEVWVWAVGGWLLQGKWLFCGSKRLEGAEGVLGVDARKAGAKGERTAILK